MIKTLDEFRMHEDNVHTPGVKKLLQKRMIKTEIQGVIDKCKKWEDCKLTHKDIVAVLQEEIDELNKKD